MDSLTETRILHKGLIFSMELDWNNNQSLLDTLIIPIKPVSTANLIDKIILEKMLLLVNITKILLSLSTLALHSPPLYPHGT